jgi:hypothetical protein
MIPVFADHIDLLDRQPPPGVIHWACPVPYFGDPRGARVATVGINPSNREFTDVQGAELEGDDRRLPTLSSLGLGRWADADSRHLGSVVAACGDYFRNRPYDRWFSVLDRILRPLGHSYYGLAPSAFHVDLVPFATHDKWGTFPTRDRDRLLEVNGESFGLLVRSSGVKLLVLNGRSVVEAFQTACGVELDTVPMAGWDLPRSTGDRIKGFGYLGSITELAGVPLERDILVAGFNHNLQSSFGVTGNAIESIGGWLATLSRQDE